MIDDKADRTDVRRVKEFLVRYLQVSHCVMNCGVYLLLWLKALVDVRTPSQENSPEEGPGGDGLAGAKGFRCLSCNRPIPKMRVRPGASRVLSIALTFHASPFFMSSW